MEWREAVSDGQSGGKKRTIGEKRTTKSLSCRYHPKGQIVIFSRRYQSVCSDIKSATRADKRTFGKITICKLILLLQEK